MSDYNLLTHGQLVKENQRLRDNLNKLEVNNLDLRVTITNLHNQLDENNKCTARCQPPPQTYKELELKVKNFEDEKEKAIQDLWHDTIIPLQNQVKDKNLQLDSAYKKEVRQSEQISSLKKTIENLNVIINYAVGYISACEQFRDKHPNHVKRWLFEGLK